MTFTVDSPTVTGKKRLVGKWKRSSHLPGVNIGERRPIREELDREGHIGPARSVAMIAQARISEEFELA